MFGRFPLLLVPETDTKGDTPLVLFASLHGKMASRTLLSKIYEVKKNNQLYLCNKKSVVVTHQGQKNGKVVQYLVCKLALFLSYFSAHHVLLHLNTWT